MVFQHFNLFNNLNVLNNMTLAPLELKKATPEKAKEKAMEMLARVGLEEKAEAYPSQLSGGQKQRMTIARALIRKPDILILDDSASALDFATDAKLRMAIRGMSRTLTTFIVSQRAASVQYADQILVMKEGNIIEQGNHEQLLAQKGFYYQLYFSQ